MRATFSRKAALLCSAALFSATSALAQDADIDTSSEDFALDEIVLKKSKREIQTETATSVTVVGQDEINDRQAGTIAELVDSVPGVTIVNGASPQGSGINIRGFGANGTYGSDQKVLIQVDGASVGSEELYRISTQLFTDPALYKEVSVLRGLGGSFEYGSGAIGGVVLLETKDASDFTGGEVGFRFRQTLQGSTNGNGFASSSILAWQPTENFEVLGNFTYNKQSEQKDGDGNVIGNSAFELPSWAIKARGYFGQDREHSVTLSHTDSQVQDRDVPYDSFGTTSDSFGNVDRDIDNSATVLTYNYDSLSSDLINLDVQYSYADQQIDQTYVSGSSPLEFTPSWPFLEPLVNSNHRYETSKFLVKNQMNFLTGGVSHDMRVGVEVSRRERLDAASAPGGTDDRFAVFVVDDIDFGNGLTITPGVRFEDQNIKGNGTYAGDYDNSAWMGGLSARYAFGSGFAVFGSAGYTESMPIIDDLGTPLFMTQSEKARNYELGFSFSNANVFSDADALQLKATAYKTDIWDITSYSNADTVETKGLELEARYVHSTGFYTDMNANISRGEEFNAGVATDWRNSPADSLRLTLGKRFGETLDMSWEVVANAKMDRSATPSPSFTAHNLRATYNPQDGAFKDTEFRFGIENLFDQTFTPHLSTRPAPGRTLKVTLAKTF